MLWSFNRQLNQKDISCKELQWTGPWDWPSINRATEKLPEEQGVYIICFPYRDGYVIHSTGITNNFQRRMMQHDRSFKKGQYTILNTEKAMSGIREEVWHGWKYARDNADKFEERKSDILLALDIQLKSYKIFTVKLDDKRLRERLESAIMLNIYVQNEDWSDLQDRGMMLRGRYTYEMPIKGLNKVPFRIYGLKEEIEF